MNFDDAMGWLADRGAEIRLSRSPEGNARSISIEIAHASVQRFVPNVPLKQIGDVSLFEGYFIDAVGELRMLAAK